MTEKNKSGKPPTHGMNALIRRGPDALNEDTRKHLTYLDELIKTAAGRAEIHHEVTAILALIVLEMSKYFLANAEDTTQKNNVVLNSNMRLLLQYLKEYPDEAEGIAPTVLDALAKAEEAQDKQGWSVKNE